MRFPKQIPTWLVILPGCLLALAIRIVFFDAVSGDFAGPLTDWYNYIKTHGGIYAFKDKFYDYTPAYVYLILIATYIPIPFIYYIKIVSVLFDFLAAIVVSRLLALKYRNPLVLISGFFIILIHPNVVINSSLWGQCDVIFTFFCLLSVYYMMKEKYWFSLLSFSIAFSLKLQSAFLVLPFIILFIYRKIGIRHFIQIPAVYFITIVPCLIVGRSLLSLLRIYMSQAGKYPDLTLSAPSVYAFFINAPFHEYNRAGILVAAFALYILSFLFIERKLELTKDNLVRISMTSLLIIPYLLPRMHERYFFPADIFSIVYAFYFPRYFFVPIVVGAVSAFCYHGYLFERFLVSLQTMSALMGSVTVVVVADLIKNLVAASKSPDLKSSPRS